VCVVLMCMLWKSMSNEFTRAKSSAGMFKNTIVLCVYLRMQLFYSFMHTCSCSTFYSYTYIHVDDFTRVNIHVDDFTRVKSPTPVSGCLQTCSGSGLFLVYNICFANAYDRRFYTCKFVHNTLLSHTYICMYEYFAVYKYLYFSPTYC